MNELASIAVASAFYLSGSSFVFYALIQYQLVGWTLWELWQKRGRKAPGPDARTEWPHVTVQLPIFNERFVVNELLDNIVQLDYPRDRFEIQVLDDSTDETVATVAAKIASLGLTHPDVRIVHLHRTDRTGFKAGALEAGTQSARGEFLAIFDADFLPRSDFLKVTVPVLDDPQVACVQTRWEHINADYSALTTVQAVLIDAHLSVEQPGRQAAGAFIHFNGTGGVWRKTAIADAGGWEHDTLVEDVDLSYRAQLKGWKIRFLEEIGCPSQLPITMDALRTQQFRWTKGNAQVGRKMLWRVLTAKQPWLVKINAFSQFVSATSYLFSLLPALLTVPLLIAPHQSESQTPMHPLITVLPAILSQLTTYSFALLLFVSRLKREPFRGPGWIVRFLVKYLLFVTYYMGISLHNGYAAIEGFLGLKSGFVRTPKWNLAELGAAGASGQYLSPKVPAVVYVECLMAAYFLAAIGYAVWVRDFRFIVFHTQMALGYLFVAGYTFIHAFEIVRMVRKARASAGERAAALINANAAPAPALPLGLIAGMNGETNYVKTDDTNIGAGGADDGTQRLAPQFARGSLAADADYADAIATPAP